MKKTLLFSALVILLIAGVVLLYSNDDPPELLDMSDPEYTYTVRFEPGQKFCYVKGTDNGFGTDEVWAVSNSVDLKKFSGRTVKLKGKFVYTKTLEDCKMQPGTGYVALQVEEVIPFQ